MELPRFLAFIFIEKKLGHPPFMNLGSRTLPRKFMKPDLTGRRIVLRTIGPQDAADLFEIYGNPLTMEFASDPCFTSPAMVAQMMA